MSGLPVAQALAAIIEGIESEECIARVVRVPSTVDLGVIGLTAAELAGSGVAVGLQAKGTVLIHQKGLAPLACLELLSIAPLLTAEMYRELGANAGRLRQGPAAGAGAQPVHRPGHRGAVPRRGGGSGRHRARRERARRAARRPGGGAMSGGAFAARALSGRPIEELTLEAAVRGDLSPADCASTRHAAPPGRGRRDARQPAARREPEARGGADRAGRRRGTRDLRGAPAGPVDGRRPRGRRRPSRRGRRAALRRAGA